MSEPGRRRRVSITKLQRDSAAVVELLNLCQTVTADGHLTPEEVEDLRAWLTANAAVDLPAHEFLQQTVERIIADGVVTTSERRELYMAIERVLPADLRDDVRGSRISREELARQPERERKERVAALKREERLQNIPVGRWDFMVAGVRYEGRADAIREFVDGGELAFVVREHDNRFSRNACAIHAESGHQIGYVPEVLAVDIAPLLDSGHRQEAFIKKVLEGRVAPIPVVKLQLHRPEATAGQLVSRDQLPVPAPVTRRQSAPVDFDAPKKSGCATVLAAIAVLWLIAGSIQ